ncbi:hypothetical protein [Saccharibacillus sacchari]|uniref:Uncharacterized protein n=1 Tax=Saccharibacillus sacchari TaxID=456493 RepID=A0ACC6P8V7_9BACL
MNKTQIMKLHYAGPRRNVGFTFFAAKNGEPVAEFRRIFLYEIDAEFILARLRLKYPLPDPESGERVESFDPCWENPVPKAVWAAIAEELQSIRPRDEAEADFRNAFGQWLQEALEVGDYVTVSGNL